MYDAESRTGSRPSEAGNGADRASTALPRRRRRSHLAGPLLPDADATTTGAPFSAFTPAVPAVPAQAPGGAAAAFRAGTGRGGQPVPPIGLEIAD